MHYLDLLGVAYIGVWVWGGFTIMREARRHTGLVRLMAWLAIILGPFAMLVYLGFRYVGQSIQTQALLTAERQRHLP